MFYKRYIICINKNGNKNTGIYKMCSCCKQKILHDFHKKSSTKNGLSNVCKDCIKIKSKNYTENKTKLMRKGKYIGTATNQK
jgi:hypothetical protein